MLQLSAEGLSVILCPSGSTGCAAAKTGRSPLGSREIDDDDGNITYQASTPPTSTYSSNSSSEVVAIIVVVAARLLLNKSKYSPECGLLLRCCCCCSWQEEQQRERGRRKICDTTNWYEVSLKKTCISEDGGWEHQKEGDEACALG